MVLEEAKFDVEGNLAMGRETLVSLCWDLEAKDTLYSVVHGQGKMFK